MRLRDAEATVLGPCPCRPSIVHKLSPAFTSFFFFSFVRYEPWVRHAGGLLTTGLLGAFRPEIHTAYEDHCSRPTFPSRFTISGFASYSVYRRAVAKTQHPWLPPKESLRGISQNITPE